MQMRCECQFNECISKLIEFILEWMANSQIRKPIMGIILKSSTNLTLYACLCLENVLTDECLCAPGER